ncbi:MAG TPA: NAD(P)/FAD-dependent oxidoreductase [Candidatus Eisenbacteria bacterium]|nr:NAD(P)/FAD-dependent oxidoreductase [Candidatus Eisenbacteria bacterium]
MRVETVTRSEPGRHREAPAEHHVVIVGGGFGGLYAAQALRRAPVRVTLVDRRNFHLFQPLLYQIAVGGLSPGDIASPLRSVFRRSNTQVIMDHAVRIDPAERKLILRQRELIYDSLILAPGGHHSYFGKDHWETYAPGLKTIEDALDIRRRVFSSFERAELEEDLDKRRGYLTFVIVGGGPTGVELAGALGELTRTTLRDDFRNIKPAQSTILLLEGARRILPSYPEALSLKAQRSLERLGVTVVLGALVTDVGRDRVVYRSGADSRELRAGSILWAAGMQASSLGRELSRSTGAEIDRAGRVIVGGDLSVPGYPNIFVIGDLAHVRGADGTPLPGLATVAMQEGRYVARLIAARLERRSLPSFRFRHRGNLAVIGRNAAVADLGRVKFSGFPAWLIWAIVHIAYLIEFDNKVLVMIQWAWNYFTRKRGARLITETVRVRPDIPP